MSTEPSPARVQADVVLEELAAAMKAANQLGAADRGAAFRAELLPKLAALSAIASEWEISGYTPEKIHGLRRHLAAWCGCGEDNGHPSLQHYVWSLSELGALRGPLTFPRGDSTRPPSKLE